MRPEGDAGEAAGNEGDRAEGSPPEAVVVEDSPSDRLLLSRVVEARGYRVRSCADGESALALIGERPVPLVLLDLGLPGMNGVELCRRLRHDPNGRDAVIVVVTAAEGSEALEATLAAGADDFLRKPVDPALLDVRLAVARRRIRERARRRRAEAELASVRDERETLFRNLHVVFFSIDLEAGRLLQASPAARKILGAEPEDLLRDPGLAARLILPPPAGGEPWADLRDADAPVLVREYELEIDGGTRRWVRASAQISRDARGRATRVDGTLADVTEERRSRAELALRTEELAALSRIGGASLAAASPGEAFRASLSVIAESLSVPVALLVRLQEDGSAAVPLAAVGIEEPPAGAFPLDPEGFCGRAVATGRPVVERDQRRLRAELPRLLREAGLKTCAAVPARGAPASGGLLLAGSTDEASWTPGRLRMAANLATAAATYGDRLEAEDALRESEGRHRALSGELQRANRELEAFAYSVSHDLRAPLRTMQGFAHALLQDHGDALPPEARDYLRRIVASGRQAEALISDLLAYSRLSFEEFSVSPVDLNAVVDAALDQVQGYVDEADADVRVQGELPPVLAHHTTLVQILANLLSNAVKFTAAGVRPEVRIRAEAREDTVRIWVEDNGVGVPEGQEERIFRVFERLEGAEHRPGTGIGLAIVRRGAERVGGACGVERRPRGGSGFWVDVPALRERRRRPRRSRRRFFS